MEAVCDLPADLPGAAPAELESYRSITENLEKALPERLVRRSDNSLSYPVLAISQICA